MSVRHIPVYVIFRDVHPDRTKAAMRHASVYQQTTGQRSPDKPKPLGRSEMRRRDLLKYAGATALAAPFVRAAKADQTIVKVGVVGAKTGPLAPGAAVTHFPPWRLWAQQINQNGGLKLKDGQRKVELIEYDDRTQPPEVHQGGRTPGRDRQGRLDRGTVRHRLQHRRGADFRQARLSADPGRLRH